VGSAGGVQGAIVWGGEWNDEKKKHIVALDGHQSMNLYTTTNQKQSAVMKGAMAGRREEQEVRRAGGAGGAISLFFGGGKSKLK